MMKAAFLLAISVLYSVSAADDETWITNSDIAYKCHGETWGFGPKSAQEFNDITVSCDEIIDQGDGFIKQCQVTGGYPYTLYMTFRPRGKPYETNEKYCYMIDALFPPDYDYDYEADDIRMSYEQSCVTCEQLTNNTDDCPFKANNLYTIPFEVDVPSIANQELNIAVTGFRGSIPTEVLPGDDELISLDDAEYCNLIGLIAVPDPDAVNSTD